MSSHRMYSVFDQKAEAYARPFCAPTRGMAIRGFSDEVNRSESEIGKHAGDYFLFEIGTFDERTGLMEPAVPLISLGCAVTYRQVDDIGRGPVKYERELRKEG